MALLLDAPIRRACTLNARHIALARIEEKLGQRMLLCTQNEAAGSVRVFHMHGQLFQSRCSNRACLTEPFEDSRTYKQRSEIPSCSCGSLLRPHIVWFNESPLYMREVIPAIEQCDIFLTVGNSGVVQPAASFPLIAGSTGWSGFPMNSNLGAAQWSKLSSMKRHPALSAAVWSGSAEPAPSRREKSAWKPSTPSSSSGPTPIGSRNQSDDATLGIEGESHEPLILCDLASDLREGWPVDATLSSLKSA